MIHKCECKHDFQDKTHGHGMRVMNRAGNKDAPKLRCTVCDKVITKGEKKK